jgi:hypothetical protein
MYKLNEFIVAASLGAALVGNASASATVPLDTFGPIDGFLSTGAAVLVGQEIALPFAITAGGSITSIETGLHISRSGANPCSGWRVGVIAASDLLGTDIQPGFSQSIWKAYVDFGAPSVDVRCSPALPEPAGQVNLAGLDWFLDPGQYLLAAAFRTDTETGYWDTTSSVMSDSWAFQIIGEGSITPGWNPCGGRYPWVTVAGCGLEPMATPVARIAFEPGLRVPELGCCRFSRHRPKLLELSRTLSD